MIELIVFEFLKKELNVPVKTERPENEPEEYVLMEKVGSSSENHIMSATIAIQSYAATMFRAAKLNEEVKNAMNRLNVLDDISRAKLNTDYNYTDQKKKKYRYQAIYDLFY